MPEQPCLQAAGVSLHFNDIHSVLAQSCNSITTPGSKPNLLAWKCGTPKQGMTDTPACLVWYSGTGLSVSSAPQRFVSAHNTGLCLWNAASAVDVSPLNKLGDILVTRWRQMLILRNTSKVDESKSKGTGFSLLETRSSDRCAPGMSSISGRKASSGTFHLQTEAQLPLKVQVWLLTTVALYRRIIPLYYVPPTSLSSLNSVLSDTFKLFQNFIMLLKVLALQLLIILLRSEDSLPQHQISVLLHQQEDKPSPPPTKSTAQVDGLGWYISPLALKS